MRRAGAVGLVALAAMVATLGARSGQDAPPVSARSGVERYTAVVQGVVTAADSGAPVQDAEVRLVGSGRHRLTATDAAGRYAFTDLPPERMTLHVSKAGFVDAQYGQRHPLEEPDPILLGEGQQVTANVTMSRGGVIYGRVFDEHGEPAAGAFVQALLARTLQGRPGLQRVGISDQSDDTGAFRVYGLTPGTYYVSAQPGPAGTVKRGSATYYPSTASTASALPVEIGTGSQVPVSITLNPASLARVSGVVVNAAGVPSAAVVSLISDDLLTARGLNGPANLTVGAFRISGDAGPDGRFTIAEVPPGSYALTATLNPPAPQSSRPPDGATEAQRQAIQEDLMVALLIRLRAQETASLPVTIAGQDVSGLTLVTRPRPMLSGRFVAAPGVRQPLPAGLSMIALAQGSPVQFLRNQSGETFEIPAPIGPFVLSVGLSFGPTLPPGWTVSAIRLNGRDVTDETMEVFGDTTVEVVLTDRVTTVTGTVRAGRDADVAGTSVVVFPRDEGKWTYPARAIRSARTDAGGRFEITGLPPGHRYLAVAVSYLVVEEEYDAAFLESVRGEATGFELSDEGDQRTLRLDLVTR
jgi:hypothetical protein